MSPQSLLDVRLFGDFALRFGETPLPSVVPPRAQSLLAYLLVHRDAPQPRDRLAFLLWPDSTEAQARTNLRHVLHDLRRALPDAERFLDVSARTLQWRPEAPCQIDTVQFEQALLRGHEESDDGLSALRRAVETYAGDLLAASYDEWIVPERERLRQRQINALERLSAVLEARGEHAEALSHAETLLRFDPLRESSHRALIRLHAARGDNASAARAYHNCRELLQRELGTSPSAATRELYERLLKPRIARVGSRDAPGPPLVGRSAEWIHLTDTWMATERDGARLVMLAGEPGIGKTRLAEELCAWCEQRGAVTVWARSYAAEGELSYAPVVAWLRADAVFAHLADLAPSHRAELARLLPELANDHSQPPYVDFTPDGEGRQRLFDAVCAALAALRAPLLLVVDDVQWCDVETLRLIHYLVRTSMRAPLLVVTTARDEDLNEVHPARQLVTALAALNRVSELAVPRLSRNETALLSERMTQTVLDTEDVDRLFAGTAGNPLFVLEMLRAGWQDGRLAERPLAPRVQAVIEGRLARLTQTAREVAGGAAAIGREFSVELVARSCGIDGDTAVRALDALWRRRVVREVGRDTYDFTHDRVREVAYLTLGPASRRRTHQRIARALEELHRECVGPLSAQIAAHHESAGDPDQAVSWYERAADEALARYANAEAVRLLDRALDLVRARDAAVDRDVSELAILTRVVAPLSAVEGHGSPRIADMQKRAVELTHNLGARPEPPLLRSLAFGRVVAGDFAAARVHAEQLRARAREVSDHAALVESDYMLGIAAFWQGELADARRHFENVVLQYRDELRASHLGRYALDPQVVCMSRLSNTLAFLGLDDDAVRLGEAAVSLARNVGHPQSYSTALVFASLLALELRDHEQLRGHAAMLAAEAAKDEAPQVRVAADVFGGYLDSLDGRTGGVDRVRRAVDAMLATPAAPGVAALAARVLLEACVVRRDGRGGLDAVDRMRRAPSGSALWAAETARLRAEFLVLERAPGDEVRRALEHARTLARAQGAVLFERRAQESLRRLRLTN